MKTVSNLVGLDKDIAKAQILTDGFVVGTETAVNSSLEADAVNHNKVKTQNPAAGTLFSYELPVDIEYTMFSFTPFSVFGFSPFGVFGFSPFGVFGFSPFGVFGFSPFGVFSFSFSVFGFSPFGVFSFR